MKKISLILVMLSFSSSLLAQDIPPDPYRVATPKEITLFETPREIMQNEIEKNLCNSTWEISEKPFMLSIHPEEAVIIVNYYKEFGNVPRYLKTINFRLDAKRESSFAKAVSAEIEKETDANTARVNKTPMAEMMKLAEAAKTSPAAQKQLDAMKTQTNKYFKNITVLGNSLKYGAVDVEINENYIDNAPSGRTTRTLAITAPGIQQGYLDIEYPDEDDDYDTLYNTKLYIGNWPKRSKSETLSFYFVKNNSPDPIIENMLVMISTNNYHKMMKIINSIDWTKLKALVKN